MTLPPARRLLPQGLGGASLLIAVCLGASCGAKTGLEHDAAAGRVEDGGPQRPGEPCARSTDCEGHCLVVCDDDPSTPDCDPYTGEFPGATGECAGTQRFCWFEFDDDGEIVPTPCP